MSKKLLLVACVIVLLVSVVSVANAGWLFGKDKVDTSSLKGETKKVGATQKFEAELTEANHYKLIQAVPTPQLETSQERKNLVRRLETFNNENKISYIYLVSYGKVMTFYTVKGKVSSVNSKLTSGEQIVPGYNGYYSNSNGKVVESPQLDGSYGTNGDAIFFYTTENVYVEWNGNYLLADQPLTLVTPPALYREIK